MTENLNRALRSKNSPKIQIIISNRFLYLLTRNFARSFLLHRIRFLPIFNTFCWTVLEIFDQAFSRFCKIGVPFKVCLSFINIQKNFVLRMDLFRLVYHHVLLAIIDKLLQYNHESLQTIDMFPLIEK